MERIMKAQALRDNSMTSYMVSKKTLEINPKHGIIKELKAQLDKDANSSNIKDTVWLLYDTSLLNSGFGIEDPNTFAKRMYKMILFGLQDDTLPETEEKKMLVKIKLKLNLKKRKKKNQLIVSLNQLIK